EQFSHTPWSQRHREPVPRRVISRGGLAGSVAAQAGGKRRRTAGWAPRRRPGIGQRAHTRLDQIAETALALAAARGLLTVLELQQNKTRPRFRRRRSVRGRRSAARAPPRPRLTV